jgi:hypothetical protein
MTALARAGRRAEALAHYADCAALLTRELGIAPAAETAALYAQILATDGEAVGARPPQQKKGATGTAAAAPPTFVGRARELARLDEALALALAGQGQVRLVMGEAGSGKTALLATFARRALAAHPHLLVVCGSGNAFTGLGDAYWPFLQMLRQLYAAPQADAAASTAVSPLQIQYLDTARPLVQQLVAQRSPALLPFLTGGGGATAVPDAPPISLFAPIDQALRAIAAEYPLLLLLDDLQWSDENSLNLLFHLSRRLAGRRILLLGAFRPAGMGQNQAAPIYLQTQDEAQQRPFVALIQEMQRYLGDIQLDLGQAAGQDFVTALLDSEPNHLDDAFRETLCWHTGGTPCSPLNCCAGCRHGAIWRATAVAFG